MMLSRRFPIALLLFIVSFSPLHTQENNAFGDDVEILSNGTQLFPHLVARSNGELYAGFFVATDGTVQIFRSSNQGVSWNLFNRVNWDSLGATVNDLDLLLVEGDSLCLFVGLSLSYGGAGVERLAVYRVNLNNGYETVAYVRDYVSPLLVRSPRLASDYQNFSTYRVRVAWLVSGPAGDSLVYSTSLNTGTTWTTPSLSYAPGSALSNLSIAYGNSFWWATWDQNNQIFAKDLLTTGGNPKNLTGNSPYPHYRPSLAISDTINNRNGTTMVACFIRNWTTDLGCIYVYSYNGGQSWSSVNSPLGTDTVSLDEFNPHVSYSRKAKSFYFAYVARDVINDSTRAYRIRTYSADYNTPNSLSSIAPRVNDDSTGGSIFTDPFILDNPVLQNQPMVVWRHWPGFGDGRIRFDAGYVVADVQTADGMPHNHYLFQNYPNPFNPSTNIRYRISVPGFVTLRVYNLLGQEIATLVNQVRQPGVYSETWNGQTVNGQPLPSGIYFYRLDTGTFSETKKLLLIK